jgi:hypothetical protein
MGELETVGIKGKFLTSKPAIVIVAVRNLENSLFARSPRFRHNLFSMIKINPAVNLLTL